ncbi:MAG TPA: hypothetical protein VFG29_04390 [Syntrophales bacterium]|nr:hypothetical protein [Syntrophales bacterium]
MGKQKETYEIRICEVRQIAKTWNVDVRVYRSKMEMIRDIRSGKAIHPVFARRMSV